MGARKKMSKSVKKIFGVKNFVQGGPFPNKGEVDFNFYTVVYYLCLLTH